MVDRMVGVRVSEGEHKEVAQDSQELEMKDGPKETVLDPVDEGLQRLHRELLLETRSPRRHRR